MLSRRLKTIVLLSRIALWGVVSAWGLVLVAWLTLNGLIVPRIGEFRLELEAQATRALGLPVRIGAVTAESGGWLPSIALRDVVLFDAEQREALRLPWVQVALSPRTLWNLHFEQIHIDAPALDVRRLPNGRLRVAGLDVAHLSGDTGSDGRAADWFFSQTEFVIRQGSVRWTDEQRGAPPLSLSDVDLVVRNTGRRHRLRLDATPPADWGERFSLRGDFVQSLFSGGPSRLQRWRGQAYADFPAVDLSQLRRHADIGVQLSRGSGALRAWVGVADGQVTSAVADLALDQVDVALGERLTPLTLRSVVGRLGGERLPGGLSLTTEGLQFLADDGLRWPGGNVALRYTEPTGPASAQGEFRGDRLDLGALAQIAQRLPLPEAVHTVLAGIAPKGLVEHLQAEWQGPLDAPRQYKAGGKVSNLSLAAAPAVPTPVVAAKPPAVAVPPGVTVHEPIGRPGVQGASVSFDLTDQGGRAQVSLDDGTLTFPGVFEQPEIPMDRLSADVQWRVAGERIDVQVGKLTFANADTAGEARASWHTSDPATAPNGRRFPGHLDLQGTLSRADGTRVHRYLPLGIPKTTREYVRESVLQGQASAVKFKVRGELLEVPYTNPARGEFRIAAQIKGAEYLYVPPSMPTRDGSRWPALTQLNGELVFDRNSMRVNKAQARFAGAPNLQLPSIEARIDDLAHSVVVVNASARGPAAELLGLVNTSPLAGMTGQALAGATVSGNAEHRLRLNLPVRDVNATQLQGSVNFLGNDWRLSPQSPQFQGLKGQLSYSERGFTVTGAQGRLLGGEVRFSGGTVTGPGGAPVPDAGLLFTGEGSVSAEGLQQASELGAVAGLARNASGAATYSATLAVRRGRPLLAFTTSLQGLALNLPPPLNKLAAAAWPLRYDNTLLPDGAGRALQDQLALSLDGVLSVQYQRDVSGPEPQVLRGAVRVGQGGPTALPVALPAAEGVVAQIDLASVNIGAWQKLLQADGAARSATVAPRAGRPLPATPSGYLPTSIALKADQLVLEAYQLNKVDLTGSREGNLWRAKVDAAELKGQLEYRQPGSGGIGRVVARLARLQLAPSAASGVEKILDRQPESIPALDIVVDDLELNGKALGRVEIDAVNRFGSTREWRLNKFNITVPEASFTANGNWAAVDGAPPGAPRRTTMNFRLDVGDSGEFLKRLGTPGAIRRGKGQIEGQVAWRGSPLALDTSSLDGSFKVGMESGQFLKAEPGLAKLLGVLSLQALPRRLALDFRDVFSEGFAFDFIRGDVRITDGVAFTNNLQMKGVNAAVLMEGRADTVRETQNLKVVVVPEINAGTASLVAAVINPAIGLGTFLAQAVLRRPLIEAATQEFQIDGDWADPRVTRVPRTPASAAPVAPAEGAR